MTVKELSHPDCSLWEADLLLESGSPILLAPSPLYSSADECSLEQGTNIEERSKKKGAQTAVYWQRCEAGEARQRCDQPED